MNKSTNQPPSAYRNALMLLTLGMLQITSFAAAPVSTPPRVLILDETVDGGINSQEAIAAQLAIPGCAVDVVSAANWSLIPGTGLGGPTGFGFDSYRALIVGDPMCTGPTTNNFGTSTPSYMAALNALNSTKAVWTPRVTGNVILEGVDNALHAISLIGADKTLKRGIAFAVNDTNRTGFYYALSCYYDYTAPAFIPTLVNHLTGFGTFMVRNYYGTCFNNAHIVATHPVFTAPPALTDSELSNWNCSTHEGFDVWPPNFVVLAIALTNGTFTATDGSNGVPYILVRGEGVKVITTIHLDPPVATNNVGTTHTVCATLDTNVVPRVNVPVTFTISAGPNAVTNFTVLTGSNGVACFTYTGLGGPGVDYITASYLTHDDKTNSSETVSKIWAGTCIGFDCDNIECLTDGTYSYKFCVTNLLSSPIMTLALQNLPTNVTMTPNFFNFVPPLNPNQVTNLTVNMNAGGKTNFCFLATAFQEGAGVPPCSVPHCITLPSCCNRIITNTLTYVGSSGPTSTYNYSITIQNITGTPIKFIGFAADQTCVTFLPSIINLTLPAYGGPSLLFPSQTRTLNLQVQKTAPCPGTNYFWLSGFNSNLIACCSTRMKLPPAKCIYLTSPYDGSVVITNTSVALRAIPNPNPIPIGLPCNFTTVMFYQDSVLVGIADDATGTGNFQTTFVPQIPGTYEITAVTTLPNGEVETSDPAQLTVIAPGFDTHQHTDDHGAPHLSAGVSGSSILLNVPTVSGHQYTVEYKTNLATGTWTPLQTFSGDGSIKVITDSVTNDASRFYRATVEH